MLYRIIAILLPIIICASISLAGWTQTNGPVGGCVYGVIAAPGGIFAHLEGGGILRSTDDGGHWVNRSSGLPTMTVFSLAADGTDLFAGPSGFGVYMSTDNGGSWTARKEGLGSASAMGILIKPTSMYLATTSGCFMSTDRGAHWSAANTGLPGTTLRSIMAKGDTLFVGGLNGQIHFSTDGGAHWNLSNTGITSTRPIQLLYTDGTRIFASTGNGVFVSTNGGAGWSALSTGSAGSNTNAFLYDRNTLLMGTTTELSRSTDNGATWTPSSTGIVNKGIYGLIRSGTMLFAATWGHGVYRSTDDGSTWTHMPTGMVKSRVTTLLANGAAVIACTEGAGIQRTTNAGRDWALSHNGMKYPFCFGAGFLGTTLFVGSSDGIYRMPLLASSWTRVKASVYSRSLIVHDRTVYAGTSTGVFSSADTGNTWSGPLSITSGKSVPALLATETHVFAGTSDAGILRCTNGDTAWIQSNAGLPELNITALAQIRGTLFAGTSSNGVFVSMDHGESWSGVNTGLTSLFIRSLCSQASLLVAGTATGGVFITENGGTSWAAKNEGLEPQDIEAVVVADDILYAGSYNWGVWKRPLSEIVTSAGDGSTDVPSRIALFQNYPNPFNPNSDIRYQIPAPRGAAGSEASAVRLAVYDLLGHEVAVLVNESKMPGTYQVRFEASGLPTGVYFYRLQTGTTTLTRKLLIVR